MSFSEVHLGEMIHVKHGFAFRGDFFREEGKYVILTPGHFFEAGGFRDRPDKDRFYVGDFPESFILPKRSLIIAMTEQGAGLLGSSALAPEDDRYLHNQRIGLVTITEPDLLDDEYLYRLFNTRAVRAQINASASGTKVRHTAPERVYRVKVSIPTIDVQRKIASAIAQYDALIENNRRRMALLEKAAGLLYEEWFVRFHFPGHDHVKKVNGLPVGWKRPTLGEYAPFQYGKALREDQRVDGDVPVYGSSGRVGKHNKPFVDEPGIIIGRKGNVGAVYFSEAPFWPIDTTYYIDNENVSRFLFYALQRLQFINTDVAVPGLNRDFAHSRELIVPTDPILSQYEEKVAPLFSMAKLLERQNTQLQVARDLLLPRLMSGEVEV